MNAAGEFKEKGREKAQESQKGFFLVLQYAGITLIRVGFSLLIPKNEGKGLCPQITQRDADEEFFSCLYVNPRVLRASPGSVVAIPLVKIAQIGPYCYPCRAFAFNDCVPRAKSVLF